MLTTAQVIKLCYDRNHSIKKEMADKAKARLDKKINTTEINRNVVQEEKQGHES